MSNYKMLYSRFLEKIFSHETFGSVLLIFTIISIFFPIQYVFSTNSYEILGIKSNFTAISLYLSQILAIGLIFYTFSREKLTFKPSKLVKIGIGLTALLLIIQYFFLPSGFSGLFAYKLLWITCGFLVGYLVYKFNFWLKYRDKILFTLILLGVIQSLMAGLQVYLQHDLGLQWLGESVLSTDIPGVAEIVSRGTTLLRGYGTLPHPNILAGTLVIISIFNLYLLNKSIQSRDKILYVLTYLVVSCGTFFTYSRAGILTLFAATMAYIAIITFVKKKFELKNLAPLLIIVALLLIFSPQLGERFTWKTDNSLSDRQLFLESSIEVIEKHSIIGTGVGTNMFHMKQSLQDRMEINRIQPVHNTYFLIILEWGIFGLFIIFFFFRFLYLTLRISLSNLEQGSDNIYWLVSLASIGIAVAMLFAFDHYFYSNWSSYLLLVVLLGMTANSIKKESTTQSDNRGVVKKY